MKLREFRLKKKKTQKQMAETVGISKSMYEKLEYGITQPSLETIKKFKEVFKDFDTKIFLD